MLAGRIDTTTQVSRTLKNRLYILFGLHDFYATIQLVNFVNQSFVLASENFSDINYDH